MSEHRRKAKEISKSLHDAQKEILITDAISEQLDLLVDVGRGLIEVGLAISESIDNATRVYRRLKDN